MAELDKVQDDGIPVDDDESGIALLPMPNPRTTTLSLLRSGVVHWSAIFITGRSAWDCASEEELKRKDCRSIGVPKTCAPGGGGVRARSKVMGMGSTLLGKVTPVRLTCSLMNAGPPVLSIVVERNCPTVETTGGGAIPKSNVIVPLIRAPVKSAV